MKYSIKSCTAFRNTKSFIIPPLLHPLGTCPRQALHARTLGFVHPRTKKEMFFTSELPTDMTALLDRWRTYVEGTTRAD